MSGGKRSRTVSVPMEMRSKHPSVMIASKPEQDLRPLRSGGMELTKTGCLASTTTAICTVDLVTSDGRLINSDDANWRLHLFQESTNHVSFLYVSKDR